MGSIGCLLPILSLHIPFGGLYVYAQPRSPPIQYYILFKKPKVPGLSKKKKVKGPGPGARGPKKVRGTRPGPMVPSTFFGPRARGPGPLPLLKKYMARLLGFLNKIFSIELEEIWVEHIHIAPQRGYAVRVNKY